MINTRRLCLRPLAPNDVGPDYVAWLNEPEINRFLEVRHAPRQTLRSVQAFVASCADDPDTMLFGAYLGEDGAHIGNIKLGPIDRLIGTAELGLIIGASNARSLGLGSEMIEGVMGYAFRDLDLRKLTAGCYEANVASLRSFEKCGFVVEEYRPAGAQLDGAPHGVFELMRMRQVADV
ncbi:MAG: GNAT family N-acetyltransferase [Tateyamaria sp.]|uniref:GNAT family N-acetyltransferase n=1 Tax=Tateyamaria sp. TaxID=1929288 RepID=UPI00326D425E